MSQQSIAVLCGGQSAEHDISLLSARNVIRSLSATQYTGQVIYLAQSGQWYWVDPDSPKRFDEQRDKRLILLPGQPEKPFALAHDLQQRMAVDCVIPMLHGTRGEDGSIQGLLEILNLPYVGCDVLGSALCMKKHMAKRLLRFSGLPTPDWVCIDASKALEYSYQEISQQLGPLLFIKPSALGSSIGISKVSNQAEFDAGLQRAFQYDRQVIVEPCVVGREIECSVLGNDDPVASLPGELVSQHDYYSYEAKYNDPESLDMITPAELPEATVRYIQEIAVDAFKVLQCRGMARVDFFLTPQQEIMVNEVNTIPGFTDLSLYPKNWEISGLSFPDLLGNLIDLALARHHQDGALSHQYLGAGPSHDDLPSDSKGLE